MSQPSVTSKIEDLTPRLKRKAQYVSNKSSQMDADDAFQEMVVSILEHAESDPDFIKQTDAYIINQAAWDTGHVARSYRTYSRYNLPDLEIGRDQDDCPQTIIDITPDSFDLEADVLEMIEMESLAVAIRHLTPENSTLVTLLYKGYNNLEIAAEMGISPSAVSQRKGTIRRQLASFMTSTDSDNQQNFSEPPCLAKEATQLRTAF